MSKLSDKVAYLRGLAEGMKLSAQSDEGKLITEIIGVLGEISSAVSSLKEVQDGIDEYVDSIDEDLRRLEMRVGELDGLGEDEESFDGEEEFSGDETLLECVCPACATVFYVDENEADGETEHVCPHCGEHVCVEELEADEVPIARPVSDGEDEDDGQ